MQLLSTTWYYFVNFILTYGLLGYSQMLFSKIFSFPLLQNYVLFLYIKKQKKNLMHNISTQTKMTVSLNNIFYLNILLITNYSYSFTSVRFNMPTNNYNILLLFSFECPSVFFFFFWPKIVRFNSGCLVFFLFLQVFFSFVSWGDFLIKLFNYLITFFYYY